MKLINAVENNDLELVKKLIKAGYPLNNVNKTGYKALMIASFNCHIEIVKELIKAGASLNEKNLCEWTALIYASVNYYKEIVKELIKSGASITDKNNIGNMALDINKEMWQSYEIQDIILEMYPDKISLLEEKIGIHKDILLKLKMKQILGV